MTDNTITKIARQCKTTVEAVHPKKGKAKDSATITFWCGAASALKLVGHEDADWVERATVWLIATRGFSEVENIIAKADAAAKEGTE